MTWAKVLALFETLHVTLFQHRRFFSSRQCEDSTLYDNEKNASSFPLHPK